MQNALSVFLCGRSLTKRRDFNILSVLTLIIQLANLTIWIREEGEGDVIVLDLKDSRPLYEQIVERFSHLILCGALPEDEKLPSVRSLAMELSINPNTIQKAYAQLERLGFIYTVKGRGNFVSPSQTLVEARKKELKEQLLGLVREGETIGLTRKEMEEWIRQGGKEEV